MMGEKLSDIMLSLVPMIGVVSRNRLLGLCGTAGECFAIEEEELRRREKTAEQSRKVGDKRLEIFLKNRGLDSIREHACQILDDCRKTVVEVVSMLDNNYPERFRGLPDMPSVFYIKGILEINKYIRSVGIIGARRCTREGKMRAIAAAERELKQHGALISGMAKGIDSYAQTAAILNDGYTIAVLGNGPDICYPPENQKLYSEIAGRGCILSEYPPGTWPRDYMFPKRNRLIAALSDEVIVIDAGLRSGTRITVADCKKYGRAVTAC